MRRPTPRAMRLVREEIERRRVDTVSDDTQFVPAQPRGKTLRSTSIPTTRRTDPDDFTVRDVPKEAVAQAIARLAKLPPLDYECVRNKEARTLGIRPSVLDKEVQRARPETETATVRGVRLDDPEPWQEAVATNELLDRLVAGVKRHLVLADAASHIVALWIAHTWIFDRFEHTPRLGITSPTKRCGKSTLLEVLRLTCRRPLKADSISPSGVFRTVEALRPLSLIIDEADTFMRDNDELRGVLNSGYERTGQVIRVVERNNEHVPVAFATYAPVALAAIGYLQSTIVDRSIPIRMERKTAAERVEKLRAPGNRARLSDLARQLARWSAR